MNRERLEAIRDELKSAVAYGSAHEKQTMLAKALIKTIEAFLESGNGRTD